MQKGDFVKIEYTGRLESGEIFDTTNEELAKKEKIYNQNMRYGPVGVVIGGHFVLPGLEKELEKMETGDNKSITVEANEGFGERKAELVRVMPEKAFKGKNIMPGMVVDFGDVRGRVQSINAGRVRVDFNHPLAGKNLKYDVKIIEKIEGDNNKAAAVLEFFGIDNKDKFEFKGEAVDIKLRLPEPIKQRIAVLIIEFITGIKKVNFIETFEKKPKDEGEVAADGKNAEG